jgi:hypothetical protein
MTIKSFIFQLLAAPTYTLGANNKVTFNIDIRDVPPPAAVLPIVSVTTDTYTYERTNTNTGKIYTYQTLVFRLDKAHTANLLIIFSLSGTASQGVDYSNLPNPIIIPAGSTEITIMLDAPA